MSMFVCFIIEKYSQAQTNTLMLLCICNGTSTSDIRNVMAESEAMMNDSGMGEFDGYQSRFGGR
jgi:hypothetical protein